MPNTGGFQTQAFPQPAIGVEGDFASQNPYFTLDAGPGGLVAGALGVQTGRFGWATSPLDTNNAPTTVSNNGIGAVTGFVGRVGNVGRPLITTYLSFAGETIQPGFDVTLFTGGDFIVTNNGTTQALIGQKAFANLSTGLVAFAATGSTISGGNATASTVAASTFSVTGSINGNVLTVTAVGAGTIVNGATISGGATATGTQIQSQISGTAGGVGTYYVSIGEQSVASTTISGTYGTLTIGGTVTGTVAVGDLLSGTGVAAGTSVTQFLTGTGGAGTYAVNNNTVVSSTTISYAAYVETKWSAMSSGLAGETVKISDHPTG